MPTVESTVDIHDLARDAGGEIRTQKRRGITHVFLRHVATERCDLRHAREHLAKPADAGGRQRFDRSCRDAVHADPGGPKSEAKNRTFASRLAFASPITL